ncbi:hypothetical protein LTR37_011337 [Vermiconidia calcicola]|uniref:Uncharacterized protein n=1 Tax=Vermiconidia calcicola TaxID=1690605 RepID=A0ACC3N448_9PEZI|nr:hypothetical protein LTR37_011337 [Vermiconidia calcicola]
MVGNGPSPKRRRTDNGPVSAESIAQANSTLQFFTGQRHNRWMQGYAQAETNGEHANTSHKQTRADAPSTTYAGRNLRQDDATASLATAPFSERADDGQRLPLQAHASRGQSPIMAGAVNGSSPQLPRATKSPTVNLVDYESPYTNPATSNTTSAPDTSRKSMDRSARVPVQQPGLPSPVSSDGNTNSPAAPTNRSLAPMATPNNAPPQRGPGRPRKDSYQAAGTGARSGQMASPAVPTHQRVPSQSSSAVQAHQRVPSQYSPAVQAHRRVPSQSSPAVQAHRRLPSQSFPAGQWDSAQPYQSQQQRPVSMQQQDQQQAMEYRAYMAQQSSNNSAAYVPPLRQQQFSPGVPSHAPLNRQAPPPLHDFTSPFDPVAMRAHLDYIRSTVLRKIPYQQVDHGRMTLLTQAVENNDLFYVVLSQLHSLTDEPNHLPQSTRNLGSRPFEYLDTLLCPNTAISPQLLACLKRFPMAITSIKSGPLKTAYDALVETVEQFLRIWNWDKMVTECRKRQTPPLVQELVDQLGLTSPVLRITAWRAIARLVGDFTQTFDPDQGMAQLEQLYNEDLMLCQQGYRRDTAGKISACAAYRKTLEAWRQHLPRLLQHRANNQHVRNPNPNNRPQFQIPAEAFRLLRQDYGGHDSRARDMRQQQLSNIANSTASAQQIPSNALYGQPMLQAQSGPISGAASSVQMVNVGNTGIFMPTQQYPPNTGLMFPHERDQPRAQPTQPEAARSGLHQAHLRSPVLGASQPDINQALLYRYVECCVMSPQKINGIPNDTMKFGITQDMFNKLPPIQPARSAGEPPMRKLTEHLNTFRLRCAAITMKGFPDEKTWVEADNVWPDDLFLDVNGTMLEPRRKLHHGRYLPIDLTAYVKPGKNELNVTVNRMSTDTRPYEYALAVEKVKLMKHEDIMVKLKVISAKDSLAAIKKSLSGSDDDDDIAITSSNMTIKLFDPFTQSKMITTPARGKGCLHRDCFDLETFLSACRREQPGWPTVTDCWRCPICRGDIRPQTLVIDGFLLEVREELAKKNLLDTRAIVVEEDGSWKPKAEERTGVRSKSLEREERAAPTTGNVAPKKVVEIIELDD